MRKLLLIGGFIVPCTIGGLVNEKTLADLGASINLMPYKIFQKLGLGELKATAMTLQLVDKSIRQPRGIIEDVLVKVGKFIFPIDVVILDVDDKVEVPLILGRPFLAISKALIDIKDGRITLQLGEEEVVFKPRDSMRHTMDFDDTCYCQTSMLEIFLHEDYPPDVELLRLPCWISSCI
ncbi:uncharacterized protein LOC120271566 [Dioscorea cayenensis subsp. rotundata]|uniref:Uncharacterized protein LOC120271566 n=1 Tax=Dioscorea cayennensis subsp. rotundata TaxID=55577 RepID=A0AB40C356_DIOCR|nr:uncharacterized protein LOC120271566 [Dioscorea cayenensis subsp. rotundata]